jgi:hypothetical protein
MRRTFTLAVLAVATIAMGSARAEDMAGNVQFLVGQRYLEDFWQPLDRPTMFGVMVDFAPESSPVHVALGASMAWEKQTVTGSFFGDTGSVEDGFFEFSAGFVWLPVKKAIVRPYLGAGVVMLGAGTGSDWSFFDAGDTDSSFGFYGNAGVFFKVGDTFNIGIDGKIVRGTSITLVGQEGDADYTQASLLMGFSFGK